MTYSSADRAKAIAIVRENDGTIDNATLAKIRDVINAPELPARTVRNWIKTPQTEEIISQGNSAEKEFSVVELVRTDDDLTDKQRMFIEQYFICKLNGTEAAMQSYDTTDRPTAAAIASELLRNPKIRARVDARLDEFHIGANEVLARLSFHARGSMEDFIDPGSNTIDLTKAQNAYQLGLIKKYKTKFTTFTSKDGDETETSEIEIELYDAQAALRDLGKHLNLFNDKHINLNIDLTKLSDEELRRLAEGGKL